MLNLERIDPNLIRQVRDQTLQEIVHAKQESGITREEHYRQKPPPLSILKIKKRVKRFNGILKKHHINIFLDIEEGEERLFLRVLERETGELLRAFEEEEVEEMLMKLESFIGFFIDHRI